LDRYLKPTEFLDWDSFDLREEARQLTVGDQSKEEKAISLFYFMRDQIKYCITPDLFRKENFKASITLKRGYGHCVPKAVLLSSLARAIGIPCRLQFADILNHQLPPDQQKLLGTYHGYVEFLLGGRWISANPAFDLEMCDRYDIIPVEFSGLDDALFHRLDRNGRLHIEYIADHGTSDDLPYDVIISAFKDVLSQKYEFFGQEKIRMMQVTKFK
jgi:transglutaminase-like putative cysteine protease